MSGFLYIWVNLKTMNALLSILLTIDVRIIEGSNWIPIGISVFAVVISAATFVYNIWLQREIYSPDLKINYYFSKINKEFEVELVNTSQGYAYMDEVFFIYENKKKNLFTSLASDIVDIGLVDAGYDVFDDNETPDVLFEGDLGSWKNKVIKGGESILLLNVKVREDDPKHKQIYNSLLRRLAKTTIKFNYRGYMNKKMKPFKQQVFEGDVEHAKY